MAVRSTRREGLVRVSPPIATDNGKPIVGIVRSEVIVTRAAFDVSLADRDHVPYPVADPDDSTNTLSVRDTIEGPRRFIPRSEWRFARALDGTPVPDRTRVYLGGGFQPSKIYEVVYKAQNPPVVGVGPAAVRDVISHLKHASAVRCRFRPAQLTCDAWASQRGRFLRTPVLRFSRRQRHRRVRRRMTHVAAPAAAATALRTALRDGHPFEQSSTYLSVHSISDDPQTGEKDGLLCAQTESAQIFYTTHRMIWGRPLAIQRSRRTVGCARRDTAHMFEAATRARRVREPQHRAAAEKPERLPLV